MAKKIYCTDEEIQAFARSLMEQVNNTSNDLKTRKFQSAKDKELTLNFKIPDVKDDRVATLMFTLKAWTKMYALVNVYKTEVEWHGTVERIDETSFLVKDILVFPHEVTKTTVTTDQNEYNKWLNELDDETFNSLRFHGHSHVDMGVSPSSVDTDYRKRMLNNFGTPNEATDYFYIFLITNKNGLISAEIYDLQNNALYDTDQIIVETEISDNELLSAFLEDATKFIKEKTYTPPVYNYPYYAGQANHSNSSTAQTNPVKKQNNSNQTAKFKNKKKENPEIIEEDPFTQDRDLLGYYNGME